MYALSNYDIHAEKMLSMPRTNVIFIHPIAVQCSTTMPINVLDK